MNSECEQPTRRQWT